MLVDDESESWFCRVCGKCVFLSDQELQRKLAEEQVAAAMGQAPPVTSVAAGAAAMGLTMGVGGMLQAPGGGARAQAAPLQQVRLSVLPYQNRKYFGGDFCTAVLQ